MSDYQPLLDKFTSVKLYKSMRDTPMLSLEASQLHAVVESIKNELDYKLLLDITAVDNLELSHPAASRFEFIYIFRSAKYDKTIALKTNVKDMTLGVESVSDIYEVANWLEREVYDQYGVIFRNHPTLKRILNHNEFVGHPLRRDYEITKGQYCTESQDMMDEM